MRLARLAYEAPGDVPSIGGETLHVFFELGDHLGSTSVVLDKATGELVERSTYQAYGGSESDYRPERWKHFREDYRFTGKEEDVEVGLIYFGKRFLNPLLNRWVSADPLAVHGLGADPNLYAYVSGHALQSVDPIGLDESKPIPVKLDEDEAKAAGINPGQRFVIGDRGKIKSIKDAQKAGLEIYVYQKDGGYDIERAKELAEVRKMQEGQKLALKGAGESSWENDLANKIGDNKEGSAEYGSAHGECKGTHCVDSKLARDTLARLALADLANDVAGVVTGVGNVVRTAVKQVAKKGLKKGVQEGIQFALKALQKWLNKPRKIGKLKEAGEDLDKGGQLTKAGRAAEKHGSRQGSVFPKAKGNPAAKNAQGRAQLSDILDNVTSKRKNKMGGWDYYGGKHGGGARYNKKGEFVGFLEP